jgi:hypothetical protein
MSSIKELRDVVGDYLQLASDAVVEETLELGGDATSKEVLVGKLLVRAANNARVFAERKHNFSWSDATLTGTVPASSLGLGYDEMYDVESQKGSLVVSGGSFTLTATLAASSTLYEAFWPAPVKLLVEDVGGSFSVTELEATGGTFPAWTGSTGIADGTYTVWFNTEEGNMTAKHYRKVKAIRGIWLVNEDGDAEKPIHFHTKDKFQRMLLENVDRNEFGEISWNENVIIGHGRRLYCYPNNTEGVTLRVDANVWLDNYINDGDSDEFLVHGFDYMQWATIVELNRLLKVFVPRQEGNLPAPTTERDNALRSLIEADVYQTEYGEYSNLS